MPGSQSQEVISLSSGDDCPSTVVTRTPEVLSENDLVYESDRDVLLEDPPRFFNGDKDFPIVDIDTLEIEDVMSLLFNPPASHVCQRQPRKCQISASFIIDTRELAGPSD